MQDTIAAAAAAGQPLPVKDVAPGAVFLRELHSYQFVSGGYSANIPELSKPYRSYIGGSVISNATTDDAKLIEYILRHHASHLVLIEPSEVEKRLTALEQKAGA